MKEIPKRRRGTPAKFPDEVAKRPSAYTKFRAGFSVLKKPELDSPTMPKRVSVLSSDAISDLMFRISAWRDYTDDLIYEATTEYLMAKEKHQYQWDISIIVAKGSSVKEKEANVRVLQKVKILREDMLEKEMYLDLLERKHENYSNNISIISREISRRSNLS
jgi:hypothetical protein